MRKLTLFFLFVLLTSQLTGQNFNLEIVESEVSFGANKQLAFVTSFEEPFTMVKKQWWRYVKRYAIISNKRTHYENKIAAKKSQSETDIYFYSVIDDDGGTSTLNIALNKENVSRPNIKLYNQYLKDLLLDFKVDFYTTYMQDKIDDLEKKSIKISSKIEKLSKANEKLENSKKKKNAKPRTIDKKIKQNDAEIEKFRIELFAHQKQMEFLKNDLKRIK